MAGAPRRRLKKLIELTGAMAELTTVTGKVLPIGKPGSAWSEDKERWYRITSNAVAVTRLIQEEAIMFAKRHNLPVPWVHEDDDSTQSNEPAPSIEEAEATPVGHT